jgi:glycerol-3-phosphate acyltransferase PlsX
VKRGLDAGIFNETGSTLPRLGGVALAMIQPVRIAIDAMGGDHGPEVILPGALRALGHHQDIRFLFFGDEKRLRPILEASPHLAAVSSMHHTDVAVKMEDKPSQALRAGRRVSSMWLAIEAVKKGDADMAFSAGNTGALMAMSKICLHMMPHIDRPAIAAIWPTIRGQSIVLDVGATIGADAQHLFDLAIMGSAMARIVFDIPRPSVGLLNVGVEEIKGLEEVKAASRLLREAQLPSLEYFGFVEGDDIGKGTVDVVVTEGFAGNIALKTAEGTAKQIAQYLREAMSASWFSKLGYLLARPAFARLRAKMDPRNVNGGVFLGLDGVVIKSHGGSDPIGTARAIEIGYAMVRHELLQKIRENLAVSHEEEPRTGVHLPDNICDAPPSSAPAETSSL